MLSLYQRLNERFHRAEVEIAATRAEVQQLKIRLSSLDHDCIAKEDRCLQLEQKVEDIKNGFEAQSQDIEMLAASVRTPETHHTAAPSDKTTP